MTQATEISWSVVKAKEEVIGVEVRDTAQNKLGKVEDLVLDKTKGYVRYAVLSFGGILGLGEKLFALPWSSLHYDDDNDCFTINVDKESLKKAPGFDKDHWPNMADEKWNDSISNFYNNF
jgi:sporulation protein YlmC with PRC-barrel domain